MNSLWVLPHFKIWEGEGGLGVVFFGGIYFFNLTGIAQYSKPFDWCLL